MKARGASAEVPGAERRAAPARPGAAGSALLGEAAVVGADLFLVLGRELAEVVIDQPLTEFGRKIAPAAFDQLELGLLRRILARLAILVGSALRILRGVVFLGTVLRLLAALFFVGLLASRLGLIAVAGLPALLLVLLRRLRLGVLRLTAASATTPSGR